MGASVIAQQRSGMMRGVTLLVALAMAPIAAAAPHQPPTDRVLEDDLRVPFPLFPCTVPGFARRIAQSAHVLVGIEFVPEPCVADRKVSAAPAEDVTLRGMTVREAFDTLVKLDPRYAWTEVDDVLIIRPVLASSDPSHFVHRPIPSFTLIEEQLSGALHAIQAALGESTSNQHDAYAFRTPEGNRQFSVSLDTTSVLEALHASVRAHGSMWWEVSYCQPATRCECAMISFYTFDGSGLGSRAPIGRDAVSADACRPGK